MTQANITVTVRNLRNSTSILDITGEINAYAESELMDAYTEATSRGAQNIMLTMLIRVQRQEQKLLAFGLSEHYRQIFELTRLNEAIAIYSTEDEALKAVNVPVPDGS